MKELLALNVFFKKYRVRMMWGVLCVILSNIASIFVPVFVRQGIDEALFQSMLAGDIAANLNWKWVANIAIAFALLVIAAAILRGIFMYLMRQGIVVVSRRVEFDLKNNIYTHYQRLSTAFYRKNHTGDLMARIGEDVSNVRMYVGPAVMYFVNFLFTFVIVIVQMLQVNPLLTLYVLIPLPVLSFSIYYVSRLINERTTKIQEQLSLLTTKAQETFAGIRVIKSFGAEENFLHSFQETTQEYKKRSMKLALVNSLFFPLMVLMVGTSTLMVLYFGGVNSIKGGFTPGNIAEFVIYLNMLIWPVASLGWTTALVQKAAASQKRINEFLNTEASERVYTFPDFEIKNNIRIRNLQFQYENSKQVVLDIPDLEINAGKIIGICGKTGCGKSSFGNLLSRQFNGYSGEIYFDDKEIQEINLERFNEKLSLVPQDVFLFSDTIRENILMGWNGSAMENENESLEKVIKIAGLSSDIQNIPNGLDAILGERGVSLSGGQKQRVTLARALLKKAELYILDDCLSAVDNATETKIIQHLHTALKGKTVFIISHRLRLMELCDEILYIENGKIIEKGNHDSLLQLNQKYAVLYNLQQLEKVELV